MNWASGTSMQGWCSWCSVVGSGNCSSLSSTLIVYCLLLCFHTGFVDLVNFFWKQEHTVVLDDEEECHLTETAEEASESPEWYLDDYHHILLS